MNYKTFEEWKDGQWLEDGEPRTKAYTKDELLLIEMGWQYGFDAGKKIELTDEEIEEFEHLIAKAFDFSTQIKVVGLDRIIRAILRKAQEK
jgi:hypothetical protein